MWKVVKCVLYILGILFFWFSSLYFAMEIGSDKLISEKTGLWILITINSVYGVTIIASKWFRKKIKHPILWLIVLIIASILAGCGYPLGYVNKHFKW